MSARGFALLVAALGMVCAPLAHAGEKGKKAKKSAFADKLKAGSVDGGVSFLGAKGNWNILLTSKTKAATVYSVSVCGAEKTALVKAEKKGKLADKETGTADGCDTMEFRTGTGIDGVRAFVEPLPTDPRALARMGDRPPIRGPFIVTIAQDGKPVGESFLEGGNPAGEPGTFVLWGGGVATKGAKGNKGNKGKQGKRKEPMKTGTDSGMVSLGGGGNWNILLTSATKTATVYSVTVCGAKKTKLLMGEKKGNLADKKAGSAKGCDTYELRTGKAIDGVRAFVNPPPAPDPRASDRPAVQTPIQVTIKKDGKPVGGDFLKGAPFENGTYLLYGGGGVAKGGK